MTGFCLTRKKIVIFSSIVFIIFCANTAYADNTKKDNKNKDSRNEKSENKKEIYNKAVIDYYLNKIRRELINNPPAKTIKTSI